MVEVKATRVKAIDQDCFDPRVLSLYWGFLTERQRIWLRRTQNRPAPWTNDPILQVEFITNVYRQLDPGTEYAIDHILSKDASDEAKVFNIMLYRLMGSVPSTHAHIGFLDPVTYNPESVIERLRELPDDYKVFGDAYRVASYMAEGSDNKIDNVATMFGYLAGGMAETTRRIKSSRRVEEVYKVIEVMKGFGEFLAHQVVVDLLYTNNDGQKIVPFTDDEFAKPGPGCRKGVWSMMADGIVPANLTIVLEWLRDNQREALGEDFPYLTTEVGDGLEPHYMSLCDIQASLCEFHKYYRLFSGEKKVNVRKYDGPHRVVTVQTVALPIVTISEVCDMVDQPATMHNDDPVLGETVDDVMSRIDSDEEFVMPLPPGGVKGLPGQLHLPSTTSFDLLTSDGQPINITININVG